jgi:hypothetical protein
MAAAVEPVPGGDPEEAGIGAIPHSLAQAASESNRVMSSPATMSNSATVSGPMPNAATSWGVSCPVRPTGLSFPGRYRAASALTPDGETHEHHNLG